MFSGIYCKLKSSDEVNNSILIDEYNKCIFDIPMSEINQEQTNIEIMNSSDTSSVITEKSDTDKWQSGMNVRAKFSEDGEYYEAIIEKIFDNTYAVVRYLGYENEEAVKVSSLKMSKGKEAIHDQLKRVAESEENEEEEKDEMYETDECDDSWKEIDWKVGMPCRAMYKENNTIYEATVQEVNKKDRTAVLMMTGFGKPFEAKFEDMYESIPEYRVKQEKTAQIHNTEKLQKENILKVPMFHHKIPVNETPVFERNGSVSSTLPKPSISTQIECQGMMQPQTESDALACLISSNYLSGYYAGFYDCMKKFQNQNT